MRCLKPSWVNHDGGGIYSLDVHPSESKFVSGGTDGRDGGLIVVWDLRPVLSKKQQTDADIPKQLCRLEQYSCINIVRWSPNGSLLCSAGDDSVVYIWHYVGRHLGGGSLGSDKPANIEVWKHLHMLKGHSGDVLHAEWSSDCKYLASCSVDNQVIVWNAQRFPEKVVCLTDHSDFVKGVSWDPAGRYLASQSCDKTVRVYATSTWQCIKTIKEPFQESGNTTHALRLCWSSDGSTLVAAHAMNHGGPTAQIITRSDWMTNKDLVGHRKAVSCVRFSPVMYERVRKKSSHKKELGCCLALGSRDRSLTVWQDFYTRPIVTFQDLFKQGVIDLSWSGDGLTLLACSIDGSVTCALFEANELGRPLSKVEMDDHMRSKYGKSQGRNGDIVNGEDSFIANPIVLQAQARLSNGHPPSPVKQATPQMFHITPVKEIESRVTEKAVEVERKQSVTVTPNGKKRIKPIFLGSCIETITAPPPLISETVSLPPRSLSPQVQDQVSPPSLAQKKHKSKKRKEKTSASTNKPAAMKRKARSPLSQDTTSPNKKRGRPKLDENVAETAAPSTNIPDPTVDLPLVSNTTTMQISAPGVANCLTVDIDKIGQESGSFSLVVKNGEGIPGSHATVVQLSCMDGPSTLWQTLISSPVIVLAASSQLVACGCADHSINLFSSKTGRLLSPSLVLDAAPVLVNAASHYIVVITADASIYAWNTRTRSCLMSREPLNFLVSENETVSVSFVNITDNGSVIVQLSDSRTYSYSSSWRTWSLLSNETDVLYRMSLNKPLKSSFKSLQIDGPVSNYSNIPQSCSVSGIQCSSTLQSSASCVLLERKLHACNDLMSVEEYKLNMHEYVKVLANCGDRPKLREVFEGLANNQNTIDGIDSSHLLNDLLLVAARNPALAWLCAEFSERASLTNFDII